jgi:3-oxoadipate enol-lactonase
MPSASNGSVWLSWREAGPLEPGAPGEPVLCIMGLSGSSQLWWRLEPHLARRGRAIFFDNRGTGDSDRVRGPLSMADMVADALAVLDAAGEESAHVIGVSMGGMIAQHIALDHRDRVRSLILGCTTPGGRSGAPPWRLLGSAALRPLFGPSRTFPLVAPVLFAPQTLRERPDRVREDLERRIADATPAATTYAQLAAVARHDTRERLHELEGLPTLVLHGEEDRLVPPDRARELARLIPGSRLVLLASCGHLMTTDAEEEVAAAVLGHLERCAGVSASAA